LIIIGGWLYPILQVHHHQQQQQDEDMPTIEGLIFPQLIREGVAQRCSYCIIKKGCSVKFTSIGQYAKHVLYNHEGYSIYVFAEDEKRYRAELRALQKKQRQYPKQFRQP
jgi:hypothetical protein